MKIEPPLSNLIQRCQTMCVAECCGIDAHDFSPIQIASYLTMWRGCPDESEIRTIRTQIRALKSSYGSKSGCEQTTTFEDMNQIFSGGEIDSLADELLENIDVALRLIEQSETQRYKQAKKTA
jgi:hypothetical protein